MERRFRSGDKVRHFKRDFMHENDTSNQYLYRILAIANHTETGEKLVVYVSLDTHISYARPYEQFISEVDKQKYPEAIQKYRFEII